MGQTEWTSFLTQGAASIAFSLAAVALTAAASAFLFSCRYIRSLGSRRFGSGFLVSLMLRCRSSLRFHLIAGLANSGQAILAPPQLIRQVAAVVALAVAPMFLCIKDLGLSHQGVDLLLQLLLCPLLRRSLRLEHPLVAHGLVLGGIGLNLGAIQRHMVEANHAGLLAQAQNLHE